MKVICIVGLPGAGKSHLAQELRKNNNAVIFDDISDLELLEKFVKYTDKDIIITDPHFCFEFARKAAEEKIKNWSQGFVELEWIYFENDPFSCWENVLQRKDNRKLSWMSVKIFSRFYKVPDSVTALPIWKG